LAFQEDNLRQAPRNERVHLTLGNIYLKEGRLVEAERSYKQALAINPAYVDVYASLSNVYATQKRYQEAVVLLREGLRHNAQDYRLYNNLAFCYNSLGDFRGAGEVLQQALRLQPDSPELHFNLGVAYQRQGLLEQAIPEFRRAISVKFDVPMSYYFTLGMALLSHGKPGEALPVFQECYRQNPDSAIVLYNLAIVYQELGDLVMARNFAGQLQRVDPGMARRLSSRGLEPSREKRGLN
jgi:tetratricopeptide (TPR) repeat protein